MSIENEDQLSEVLEGVKKSALMTDLRRFPIMEDEDKYDSLIERKIVKAASRLISGERKDLRLKLEELAESRKSSWKEEIKQAQIEYQQSKGTYRNLKDVDEGNLSR